MNRRNQILLALGAILLMAVIWTVLHASRSFPIEQHRMADGSVLELADVVLATNNVTFSYKTGNRWLRMISGVMPGALKNRFQSGGGGASFGFGVEGTNLLLKTIVHGVNPTAPLQPGRLRVSDDAGNEYDACWGTHTGNFGAEILNGWQLRAFPRRSRELGLHFLAELPDGSWTNAVDFKIRNPAFGDYPHWKPEAWPVTRTNGDLEVTLRGFQSGGPSDVTRYRGQGPLAARMTRVVLDFAENGRPVDHWRLQKLYLSDATGNDWYPYLSLEKPGLNWATKGTAEFVGGLWPGEDAWRLRAESVRTGGFAADELWTVNLPLPPAGTVTTLTNRWDRDGLGVNLVGFGSPTVEHSGEFRWVAKWWGDHPDRTWSLGMKLDADLDGRRLTVVGVADQNGRTVEIAEHQGADHRLQAVFIRPTSEAREVRITLAVQRSRFVEFLARPEFVK